MATSNKRSAKTVLEILEASGSLFDPDAPRGRGRPRHATVGHANKLQLRIAYMVEATRLRDSRQWGAITRAVKKIAKKEGHAEAWVRKTWQRMSFGRTQAFVQHAIEGGLRELETRMLGLPEDVRERLMQAPIGPLLDLLRREGINGTSPTRFVDEVRRIDFLSQK